MALSGSRGVGASGILGGTLWTIGTVLHASRPVGCVAERCAGRAMRETSTTEGALMVVGLVLIAATATSLVVRVRRAGRLGATGWLGGLLATAGIATLVVAALVQALLFGGDLETMPYFVIPGVGAVVLGLALLGVSVLRAGVLPRWASVALLLGAAAMLGFNEQTHAAWLGLVFGGAWIAVGCALCRGPASPRGSAPRSDVVSA